MVQLQKNTALAKNVLHKKNEEKKKSQENVSTSSCGTGEGVSQKKLVDVGWQELGGYLPAEMAKYGHQGGDGERRLTFEHTAHVSRGHCALGRL